MRTATVKQTIPIQLKNTNSKSRPTIDSLTTEQLEKALNETRNM